MNEIIVRTILFLMLLSAPCAAGERSRQRFISLAATVIQQTGVPSDANGMAMTRQLRLSVIPVLPPFGVHAILGRGVAFRVNDAGQLVEPRLTRISGGGVSASIGMGLPFSGSITREVRSLHGDDYERFVMQRHTQASFKVYAGVGLPGVAKIAAVGPTVGSPIPGRLLHSRSIHVGLWTAVGVETSIKTMRQLRGR